MKSSRAFGWPVPFDAVRAEGWNPLGNVSFNSFRRARPELLAVLLTLMHTHEAVLTLQCSPLNSLNCLLIGAGVIRQQHKYLLRCTQGLKGVWRQRGCSLAWQSSPKSQRRGEDGAGLCLLLRSGTSLQHCIFVNQPVEKPPESLPQSVFSGLKLMQRSRQLDISQRIPASKFC